MSTSNIDIWQIANNGLRNPLRIQEGFKAFSESPFVGHLHGKEECEIPFENYLRERNIIHAGQTSNTDGTYARKWRLIFARFGFIYDRYRGTKKELQDELGNEDEITPFGRIFLRADTVPAMQECFLRSLGVEQYSTYDNKLFSPFRWILAIMLELEKRTESSAISRIEFALWGQTTDPSYKVDDVVDKILKLRNDRERATAKKKFDKIAQQKRAEEGGYSKNIRNFLDYGDMNMRYLRISGVILQKGRGLIINPSKHIIAEKMAKATATASEEELLNQLKKLTNGAEIPTDNFDVAKNVLNKLKEELKERRVVFNISDLPLATTLEINIARNRLEELLSQNDEIRYAQDQKHKWKEIAEYMTLLIKGRDRKELSDDCVIEIPADERPAYLEWTLWRAALAIDSLHNKPYEIRGFRIDSDFLPVSAAGGGRGDLYCEFDDYTILIEVTMSSSSRQEAMEGEPVRRHVSDEVLRSNKPVYGLFIAVNVNINTIETFRHGVWFAGEEKQRLNILPLSLEQFRDYFINMFTTNRVTSERLVDLIKSCEKKRDYMDAPAWSTYIANEVSQEINSSKAVENKLDNSITVRFPYGISFGTLILNKQRNVVGCVIGVSEDEITVAYDTKLNIKNDTVDAKDFEKGLFAVV
ncbi:restriction endonuclease [Lactobacillus delbrueckii subsp. bulgaricus]|nr:restriction endonuclease [Lactobacillus delbrueckii subsp. bulgaricus]